MAIVAGLRLTGKPSAAMRSAMLHGLDQLGPYRAPPLALVVALALTRAGRVRAVFPFVSTAVAALLGWAWLLEGARPWRMLWAPVGTAQHLVLAAAAAIGLGLVGARRHGRWIVLGAVVAVAWWVAGSPPARDEFWRVWLAGALAIGVVQWASAAEQVRGVAAPFALAAGLGAAGAAWPWPLAALVLAAAALPGLRGGVPVLPLAVLTGATATAASLGAGRLVQGRVTAVDCACVLALLAPRAVPSVARRLGTRNVAAPFIVVIGAAALTWAVRHLTFR